uniref:Ovule protein n=1 Tax=Heterorhabditis bacteriophora TaxID=37862 RepID=A0A1I7WBD7_HETBA
MFYCVFPSIINITCFYNFVLLIYTMIQERLIMKCCFFNFIILSLIVFRVKGDPMWNRHKIGNSAKY